MAKIVGVGADTGAGVISMAACLAQGGTWLRGCTPTDPWQCIPSGQPVPACAGTTPPPPQPTEQEKEREQTGSLMIGLTIAAVSAASVLGYRYFSKKPTMTGSVGAGVAGAVVAVIAERAMMQYSWSHIEIKA